MNPIKSLFNLISKFIVEHGSSDIQTKHIALLKEQLSICQKEKEIMNTTIQNLKSEIKNLRLKIDECEKINKQLQEKISQSKKPPSPGVMVTFNDPDLDKIK
jgi:predicted RNase H-like nuclease (RuvC/YqgF family)